MAELNGVVMFHFGKYFVLHFGTEHWDWWLQHDTFVNSLLKTKMNRFCDAIERVTGLSVDEVLF